MLEDSHYYFQKTADVLNLPEPPCVRVGEETKEVVLKASKTVADYFKRRKLIANQVIEKQLEDGSLILSTKVANHNQIIPIIRYWLPHLRIISPDQLCLGGQVFHCAAAEFFMNNERHGP